MASHKYRKRRFCELTVDEVVDIAHSFFVEEMCRKDIAELGLRAVLAGFMANLMSAAIAGFFLSLG